MRNQKAKEQKLMAKRIDHNFNLQCTFRPGLTKDEVNNILINGSTEERINLVGEIKQAAINCCDSILEIDGDDKLEYYFEITHSSQMIGPGPITNWFSEDFLNK